MTTWIEAGCLLLYAISGMLHLRAAVGGEAASRAGRGLVLVGVLAHGAVLSIDLATGSAPGFRESLSAVSLGIMVAVSLLGAGRLAALSIVLAPAGAAVLAASFLAPTATVAELASTGGSWWLPIHLALVFTAMASLALEVVAAGFAAVVRSRLKQKRLDALGQLPALDLLAGVQRRALVLGIVALGLGIVAGGLWAAQEMPAQAWIRSPKVAFTVGVWLWYAGCLFLRVRLGWHGRLSVAMSAIGMGALIFGLVGLDFLVAGFHGYGR